MYKTFPFYASAIVLIWLILFKAYFLLFIKCSLQRKFKLHDSFLVFPPANLKQHNVADHLQIKVVLIAEKKIMIFKNICKNMS